MKAIIKKLKITENGVKTANIIFDSFCTILNNVGNETILEIIKLLIGAKETKKSLVSIEFSAEVELVENYYITGYKQKNSKSWVLSVSKNNSDIDYTEEYFSIVKKSAEESVITSFEDISKQNYPLRLAFYKDSKYYFKGRFSKMTNGIGVTRSFQSFLSSYIKEFKSEQLNKEKDLWLTLKENGEFVVTKGEAGEETTDFSEDDFLKYNLLCFMSLVDFWDGFNNLRNINAVKTPLIIKSNEKNNFSLKKDEKQLNNKICDSDRQIVIFAGSG